MRRLDLRTTLTLLTFIAIFAMATRAVVDTDLYWHLAAGRYIVETRTVPTVDPFSSTMLGKPWVDIYWLAQVAWYLIYQAAGLAGLSLLVAALVTLTLVFVWKQLDGPVFLRALIVLLAAVVSGPVWTARPHLITYLLTAVVAYLLFLYKWKQIDRLWVVPLLFIVWVNMHGGYIAGFMLLGTFIVGEAIGNLFHVAGREIVSWWRLRKVLLISVISGLVLLINPHTINAILLPLKTVGLQTLQASIDEWASPNFHQLFQQPFIWMLLLTLVIIGWSGRRLDVTDAITLVVFAYISFLARRNIGLFALICAPILSRHAVALWEKSRWGQRQLSPGKPIVNLLILILIGCAAILKILIPLSPVVQQQADRAALPIGAADWIAQHHPSGTMFNGYNLGGYLLWRLWPNYPIYVDGRTDLYDDAFLREYQSVISTTPGFEKVFDRQDVRFIVIEKSAPLAVWLAQSDRWQLAYADDQTVIYTRPSGT
ncbi:MAG TPA: hypothetical protein VMP08_08320 [Anaerolineae bacterium]|nr:hypothetical protein [Anaerolineae bacterium]